MSDTPACPAGDECASPFCAVHAERNAARAPARLVEPSEPPADVAGLRTFIRSLGRDLGILEERISVLSRTCADLGARLDDLSDRLAKLEAANAETEPPDVDANVTM